VGSIVLTIVLGVILAVPLIYILELKGHGAITLLVFLCIGVIGIFWRITKFFSKKRRRPDAKHSIKL
jgi:hypothetical protein